MSTLFRPQSIETDYAFLDACPEALLPILVALPFGDALRHVLRLPATPGTAAGIGREVVATAADDPQLSADGRQRLQQLAQEGLRLRPRPRPGGAIPRPRSDRGRGWPRRVAEAALNHGLPVLA